MDEETLKQMFNKSNVKNDKVNMSKEESDRFQKAFEDPGIILVEHCYYLLTLIDN